MDNGKYFDRLIVQKFQAVVKIDPILFSIKLFRHQ